MLNVLIELEGLSQLQSNQTVVNAAKKRAGGVDSDQGDGRWLWRLSWSAGIGGGGKKRRLRCLDD
jgi:hypothetical protein